MERDELIYAFSGERPGEFIVFEGDGERESWTLCSLPPGNRFTLTRQQADEIIRLLGPGPDRGAVSPRPSLPTWMPWAVLFAGFVSGWFARGIPIVLARIWAPLLVLSLAWPCGAAEGRLLVGGYYSGGMGEPGVSPQVMAQASGSRWLVEGLAGTSDKAESGAGWIARGSADVLLSRLLSVGGGITHRDGGSWAKRPVWARLCIGDPRAVRLVLEAAPASRNREMKAELQARADRGRLTLEARVYVERHLQGVGAGVALMGGIR